MIDQTISHFRVIEKLGAGGMGVVYKAIDTRLDRPVALKFLPDNMAEDSQALERFRREAHAASALNHPGICTIYDIGEEHKRPFIAMEFIDGETLRQHIHGEPLPLEKILDLGMQIADALDAAHSGGIVHRDIKPSNVFVTKRGQAKVLDFGLAKLVAKDVLGLEDTDSSAKGRQDSLSIVGVISGTPAYMSPEQVRGDELDQRTDIFAFGLLLYEMATGRQAFGGRTGGAIIEAILTRAPSPVRTVNPQVPEQLEEIISKCLQKDRNLRYESAAEARADLQQLKRASESGSMRAVGPTAAAPIAAAVAMPDATAAAPVTTIHGESFPWRTVITGGAVLLVLLVVGGWFYSGRYAAALNQSDTVVLADFINKTGDPIFDDTLRQGLAAQLQQSPFLSLVSEQRIQQTLRLMGLPADGKLSPTIAGDLCQRVGSKAYLSGTISSMGNQYVIGVSAVNCRSGDYLAQEQFTADGKENVLKVLGVAATGLREKLGESLKTVQKLDTPIEQATTPSLEALQAYSLGRKTMQGQADFTAAVPLFERAIELDANFAMAHAMLGTTYHNLGEKMLAAKNTQQAYELRTHVSEWEKFYIESHYHDFVTGDLEKARQAYELWAQIYPRELVTPTNLGVIYQTMGQFDKSFAEYQEAIRLSPADSLNFGNLVLAYVHLNRLDESRATAKEALTKNLDSADLRAALYEVAFLRKDLPEMAEQVSWSTGKPGKENLMLYLEAGTAAYSGRLREARELADQAAASAARAGENEMAAGSESAAALWEALYGNAAEARRRVNGTLAHSNGRDAQYAAALALALIRDSEGAQVLADDLQKRFSEDTIVRFHYLPTLQAQIALAHPDGGAKAAGALAAAVPYELGVPGGSTFWTNLYPAYVRGEAYLDLHRGAEAAAEFQKILNWPGVVVNEPIAALAVLEIARAQALAGDAPKSKAAYQDFLKLWKDADADIPILVAARSEYEKMK
jgi:eukaryotic-like serine/threonine-protein kinase